MWLIGINVYVLFLFMSLFVTVEEDAGWLEVDPEVQETVLSSVREWTFLIQAWWLKIKTALQPHLAGFLWKSGICLLGRDVPVCELCPTLNCDLLSWWSLSFPWRNSTSPWSFSQSSALSDNISLH